MILTALETGLRKSELQHLTWKDINFKSLVVLVQAKGNWHPKNYRVRPIPIRSELALELEEHKRQQKGLSRYVFPTVFGNPRMSSMGHEIREILEGCGLYKRGVGWHTLRHTFASHLVMNGVDLPTVKNLMGHSDIQTTMIYAHLAPDHLADAVDKLGF